MWTQITTLGKQYFVCPLEIQLSLSVLAHHKSRCQIKFIHPAVLRDSAYCYINQMHLFLMNRFLIYIKCNFKNSTYDPIVLLMEYGSFMPSKTAARMRCTSVNGSSLLNNQISMVETMVFNSPHYQGHHKALK